MNKLKNLLLVLFLTGVSSVLYAATSDVDFTIKKDTLGTNGLIFQDNQTTPNTVTLKAPDTVSGDYTFKLPNSAGSKGQILKTDGNGNLDWKTSVVSVVVDNLTSTATTEALSANQGKALKTLIDVNNKSYYLGKGHHNNTWSPSFYTLSASGIIANANTFTVSKDGFYKISYIDGINSSLSGKFAKITFVTGGTLVSLNTPGLKYWDIDMPNTKSSWTEFVFDFKPIPLKKGTQVQIVFESAGGQGLDGNGYSLLNVTQL
jgi:hypothetical protein